MRWILCSMLALSCAACQTARAGEPAAPPRPGEARPKNLKVLPKDISDAELMAVMKGFSHGLGVRCDFCHVMKPQKDFAADTKNKDIAREMLQMTHRIDQEFFTWPKAPKATCFMCHRGEEKPLFAPPPPGRPAP
ncbi:MAG: c-type cytochrome [Deltaproteobacteria bacterium]